VTPGAYEILSSHNIPIYFEKIPILATNLINFPETNSEKVVSEIQKFWSKESVFRDFGLVYKRGIILWGPPGSGKSCTIQLVMRDVVARGGVVIKFTHPGLFNDGIRKFREVQPDTPLVVLMEDIDSIIQIYNESEVLNILDGVNQVDKVVFLATTNYPEQLGGRIINRPSRFDRRFRIPHPGRNSRKLYLEHLIGNREIKIDIERWADDTEDFSVAHLKELFTSVVIFGNDYEEELETLQSMREVQPSSIDDEYRKPMGFAKQCSSRTPNYPR
jgi:SpoVK/Ycf46/Vps4 family AAA+-type ATPase